MPSKNRIDLLIALANFASDYHSGQFSRGYRLSCLAEKRLRRYGIRFHFDMAMNINSMRIYDALVTTYANQM